MGGDFYGCFDLRRNRFLTSTSGKNGSFDRVFDDVTLDDQRLRELVPKNVFDPAREGAALAAGAYGNLNVRSFREGHLTPIFFGSALKDYAVHDLLDAVN